jgi:D-alanine-D-alanine ligase-like ATP-grasp enzyme
MELLPTTTEPAVQPSGPLRICVLQSDPAGCTYATDDALLAHGLQQHIVRAGYDDCLQVETIVLKAQTCAQTLVKLATRFKQKEIDCFVNLCDGAWDEPSCGIAVVELLETKLNLPYTGADRGFYEPTRLQMKKAALACGVKVPNWRFVYSQEELRTFLAEFDQSDVSTHPLRFPLLPKHFSGYSSVGLVKASKVWDVASLKRQCERMLEQFGGCLIEEFIMGREFTVLAAQVPVGSDDVGTMVYEPIECRFADGEDFKHYDLKWIDFSAMSWVTVEDPSLAARLKTLALSVFQALRGRGYGRMDVRSDPSGENLYFLEVNPNCGVFYGEGVYGSADFILDAADARTGHARFLLAQVEVAKRLWHQKNAREALVETRYTAHIDSWGLFAGRDMTAGTIIQNNEESAVHVVSKSHVLQHWEGAPRDARGDAPMTSLQTWTNFRAYAWPISDNLCVLWNPNPDKWRPLNHSCDPNAWNALGNGLNVVARRHITAGEEITMDYATFVGFFPEMTSFPCRCGSELCRGMITGLDIITVPTLAQRYHGHMTDYVARKVLERSTPDMPNWSRD